MTLVSLLLSLYLRPYNDDELQGMHQWALFVQTLTLLSGVMIKTDQFSEILGEKGGEGITALGNLLVALHFLVGLVPIISQAMQFLRLRFASTQTDGTGTSGPRSCWSSPSDEEAGDTQQESAAKAVQYKDLQQTAPQQQAPANTQELMPPGPQLSLSEIESVTLIDEQKATHTGKKKAAQTDKKKTVGQQPTYIQQNDDELHRSSDINSAQTHVILHTFGEKGLPVFPRIAENGSIQDAQMEGDAALGSPKPPPRNSSPPISANLQNADQGQLKPPPRRETSPTESAWYATLTCFEKLLLVCANFSPIIIL